MISQSQLPQTVSTLEPIVLRICSAMAPIFEQAASELEPHVRLIKVDSEAAPELQRFVIQSIPTLMLVHRGREIARQTGVMSLPKLLAWTRQHVSGVTVCRTSAH